LICHDDLKIWHKLETSNSRSHSKKVRCVRTVRWCCDRCFEPRISRYLRCKHEFKNCHLTDYDIKYIKMFVELVSHWYWSRFSNGQSDLNLLAELTISQKKSDIKYRIWNRLSILKSTDIAMCNAAILSLNSRIEIERHFFRYSENYGTYSFLSKRLFDEPLNYHITDKNDGSQFLWNKCSKIVGVYDILNINKSFLPRFNLSSEFENSTNDCFWIHSSIMTTHHRRANFNNTERLIKWHNGIKNMLIILLFIYKSHLLSK
jgi:hypothetical protein